MKCNALKPFPLCLLASVPFSHCLPFVPPCLRASVPSYSKSIAMDSEHRHELKENDLAVAVASLKDWWGKHQMKVLGGAVLAAALILGIRIMSANATSSRDGEQYELATAPTPEAYRALAAATSNESVEIQANLRGADAILPQLRKPVGSGPEAITAERRKKLLDDAQAMYQSVLSEGKHPLLKIKAHLGLASLAETRGDWAKAKEHYQAAQKVGGAGNEFLTKRAAAFEAAIPRIQIEPVYGREETAKAPDPDPLKLPFLPVDPTTPDTKDGKEKDAKEVPAVLPLIPEPTVTPEKDAKAPAPAPIPVPAPAPEKDAK